MIPISKRYAHHAKTALLLTLFGSFLACGAHAQSFGINFRNGNPPAFTVDTTSGNTYSGVPASHWHNTAATLPTVGEVVAVPDLTGVTIDFSASNTWGTNVANDIGDGYLDDHGPGYLVTVRGLSNFIPPGSSYRIKALQSSDNAASFQPVQIYSGTDASGTLLATLSTAAGGGGVQFGETNYSSGITSDAITFKGIPSAGTARSTLAGIVFEITPPPPDRYLNEENTAYNTITLADGATSVFRVGMDGVDKTTVTDPDSFSVGTGPGATHRIDITSKGLIIPGLYPLIDYSGTIGGAGFAGLSLGKIPHMVANLVNNTEESRIELEIISVESLAWNGAPGASWDIGATTNWKFLGSGTASTYLDADAVSFDDAAPGGTVNISVPVAPALVEFYNYTLAYNLSGAAITGPTSLILAGTEPVTLGGANSFSGAVTVRSGATLITADPLALGDSSSAALGLDGSSLVTTTDLTSVRRIAIGGGGGTIDTASGTTMTHRARILMDGTLVKNGEGTLNVTSYAGSTTNVAEDLVINAGTVEFGSSHFNAFPLGFGTFHATVNDGGTLRASAAHAFGGDYWDYQYSIGQLRAIGGTLEFAADHYIPRGTHDNAGRILLQGGGIVGAGRLMSVGYPPEATVLDQFSTISVLPSTQPSEIRINTLGTYDRVLVIDVADGEAAEDLVITSAIDGGNGIRKTGAGNLVLAGNSPLTGPVEIAAGSLSLEASMPTAPLVLAPGTRFGGNGLIDFAAAASADIGGEWVVDFDATGMDSLALGGVLDIAGATLGFEGIEEPTLQSYTVATYSSLTGTFAFPPTGIPDGYQLVMGETAMTLTSTTGDAYAAWASSNGLVGANALATADPDGDGVANLIEFVLGTDPVVRSAGLPTAGFDGPDLVFSFTRSDASEYLAPAAEYSTDLVEWTPGPAPVLVEENGTDPDQVEVRMPASLADGGKLFVRLTVTAP